MRWGIENSLPFDERNGEAEDNNREENLRAVVSISFCMHYICLDDGKQGRYLEGSKTSYDKHDGLDVCCEY